MIINQAGSVSSNGLSKLFSISILVTLAATAIMGCNQASSGDNASANEDQFVEEADTDEADGKSKCAGVDNSDQIESIGIEDFNPGYDDSFLGLMNYESKTLTVFGENESGNRVKCVHIQATVTQTGSFTLKKPYKKITNSSGSATFTISGKNGDTDGAIMFSVTQSNGTIIKKDLEIAPYTCKSITCEWGD